MLRKQTIKKMNYGGILIGIRLKNIPNKNILPCLGHPNT